jgi:hypothetical protein
VVGRYRNGFVWKRLLEVPYLQPFDRCCSSTHTFKGWESGASGILYGPQARAIVTIPVNHVRNNAPPTLNVHFIADMSSPTTEMSPAAFRALLHLSAADACPERGGVKHAVRKCSPAGEYEHLPVLQVLGVDFFKHIRARLAFDYCQLTVRMVSIDALAAVELL